eukprot:m.356975 g.356975  ORF g.356975 m.356975 type:complete len:711 (-) comp28021_c0_seq5:2693-4825(-)
MGHRAGVDPSCVRRCAAARRGNYAWLWGVGLLLLSGGTSGNDLVKSVREHLEAAVGRVVGAQDPALEMGFDPCGTHGKLVSRTMCACNFSCAGSMCTKGSGPRGLVTGYDIFKCADCTCRPQRQPDEFSEIECPAGAPPPEVALVVVCCKSAPAQDGEIEVLTPEEAAAGDAWYSLAANKVAICHTVVVRTLGYHTEPIESSILHFLAERYDTMPQMVFFARAANTWLDQIDKHRLLGELSAIPQITAAAPYLPFPAPLITLDEHALSDLRLWWTSNITASANGPPFPEIDPGGKISCCSQFGLFGQAAKQHPRELYVLLRNWAIVHPHKSSKILELVWPLLFRRTLVGAVRAASMWRSARVRAFCKPWKCTCQGFSERFGSRPGTIGDVTEEEEHWWDHGIWDEWAHYIVDATDHSKNHAWALESPSDRENHGTGKCMTSPKHLGIRVLPAKRAAVGEALPKQAIPRIVWQTHYTNKIPPAGQYMFDMRSRNPEYEFRLVGDAEADTFMKTFPLKRVAQAYFSINPACGAARADIWRYATLWTHGGIYIDIDATCKRLRDIILPADTAILSYGGKWHRKFCSWDREIDQWVLMFAPKHPFLKRAMMVAAARVLDPSKLGKEIANMHQHVLETTGPILLKNAVEYVLREMPRVSHRIVTEDYEGNCTFKVLGWGNNALDVTKPQSKSGQQDYKQMGGQVFARPGLWPRRK